MLGRASEPPRRWRHFWPYTLRLRLALACALVEMLLLSALIANSLRLLDNAAQLSVDTAAAQAAPMLNAAALPYLLQRDFAGLQDTLRVAVGARHGELVYIAINDRDGRRIAVAGMDFNAALPPPSLPGSAISGEIYHIERPVGLAGQTYGSMRLGISTRVIAQTRRDLLRQGILIAALEVGLSLGLLGLIGYWLTRHLDATVKASRAIAAGDFSLRLPEQGGAEVAELARALNRMSMEIERRLAALHASEHEFRTQFEQAGVGIAHLLPNGNWLRSNHKFAAILGYRQPVLPLLAELWHPDEQVEAQRTVQALLAGDQTLWQQEYRCLGGQGDYRWYLLNLSHYRDETGAVAYLIVVLQDISDAKAAEAELRRYREELEALVEERTRALALANKELESFAYSVSHDLRSPLRAVNGFAQVLDEDFAAELSAPAHDYLGRILQASKRMDKLIDALLGLSHISQHHMVRRQVDLTQLARNVLDELAVAQPDRQVVLEIAADVLVQADQDLCGVIMQNLLGNAWKYSSKVAHAKIRFGVQRQAGEAVFYVGDNGAGFDPQHAGRLFGAFQRLHAAEEFEGTGIGLATVARAVHRHEGRIWAEAQPGEGATFFFTLGNGN